MAASRRRLRRLGAAAVVAVVSGLIAAYGPPGPPASPAPAPRGLPPFYRVPDRFASGRPGTLLKSEVVAAPGVDGTAYRVMYVSRGTTARPVAVTGVVFVPHGPVPAGGFPVVSWGHGTNGMADQCAPSLQPAFAVPLVNALLARGWEVVGSDDQGEGTPGLLPYLVGEVAAHDTIDIVRAARHLRAAHAGTDYVVWGHSEGGHTALFSLYLSRSYAPELHLRGVVAGAPPSQFAAIDAFLGSSPYRYYLFMVAAGFHAGYGARAPLGAVLTPRALRLLPVLERGCAGYVQAALAPYSLSDLVKVDPFTVPSWRKLLEVNDPQSFTHPVRTPLLIIQGGADEQIPVVSTLLLAQHLCDLGQDVQRWIYPGQSHAGVVVPSAADMVQWIADRFAGAKGPDPYRPVGLPGVQATGCPA